MWRVFIPRHISWWMFNMNISMWPITVSMVQLFVLALWAAIVLSIWNWLNNAWVDWVVAWILVLPIAIIFIVIAFFNVSELPLVPFIAKMIRTYFFDETKKFQTCQKSVDPKNIMVSKLRTSKAEQKQEIKKTSKIDNSKIKDMSDIFW